MPKYALDLFEVLRMLDRQDMGIHDALSGDPEVLKELEKAAGWMLPLWMSASYDSGQHRQLVLNFDEKLCQVWDSAAGNPILQLKLLAACGTGRPTKHRFYKRATSKYGNRVMDLLDNIVPDIRQKEVERWINHHTEDDVIELASACGYQDKEIKGILEEFRRAKQ